MSHHDVIVIGGGQAGLAIGHHLSRQGRDFVILEAADGPAAAWRARWDSLRLFTPARYDSLPGAAFPGDPDHYPTRDEVVAYLTDYAADLTVEYGSRVTGLRAGYQVETVDRVLGAHQVVVATGPFQVPRTPPFARELVGDVTQLHSSEYRNPDQVPAGPVLVVGGGNTGYQIAEELAATHELHLSVGSRQTPLPQRVHGVDLFRILSRLGTMRATVESRIGRRLQARDTLIGSSPRKARRLGIRLRGRATGTDGSSVRFADGSTLAPRTVIWATGFARDFSWIDVPVLDASGAPIHMRGVTSAPGLYFLGLPWLHTRGSALLGWVKDDAEHIAGRIAEHAATTSGAADPAPATTFELRVGQPARHEQPSGKPPAA
jgi:putative flavoprotein involved in K+ transport